MTVKVLGVTFMSQGRSPRIALEKNFEYESPSNYVLIKWK